MAARIKENFLYKELESALFFIKNPNLKNKQKKKGLAVGRGGGGGVARVIVFFFFFSKQSKSEKKCFLLASVSEFVLQRTQI